MLPASLSTGRWEQEVANGRVVKQHGYWRWIGDLIMPPSLVELIEPSGQKLPYGVPVMIE